MIEDAGDNDGGAEAFSNGSCMNASGEFEKVEFIVRGEVRVMMWYLVRMMDDG